MNNAGTSGGPVIVAKDLRKRYDDIQAVDGVSFEVYPGEVFGMLGPNGAGKTTTLKMLSGHLYPTDGHLEVLGHTPSRRERKFLSRITLVMGQRNQLIWDIPVHGLARTQPGRIPDPTHRLQIDPG